MSHKPLVFSHRFTSGRTITLTLMRTPGERPWAASSQQFRDLTDAELAEYGPWRDATVALIMSLLTPEEVLASNQPEK